MDENIKCRTSNNKKTKKLEQEKEKVIVKIIIEDKCELMIT